MRPVHRRWAYGIFLATLPILSAYHVVSESEVPLWAALGEAVLIGSLALGNVQDDREDDDPRHRA